MGENARHHRVQSKNYTRGECTKTKFPLLLMQDLLWSAKGRGRKERTLVLGWKAKRLIWNGKCGKVRESYKNLVGIGEGGEGVEGGSFGVTQGTGAVFFDRKKGRYRS